ncbi:hypothetical protein BSKO_02314 [Bryopsis sp. KO-2023]|nr:hypothetical protein BSKO_02314 [Bryopsis sp. KO-2023]
MALAANALRREECIYTACYCEENVYKLVELLTARKIASLDELWVVFLSNPMKRFPLFCQRSSEREGGLVVWDYHVILIQRPPGGSANVWDIDTTLEFPCPIDTYAAEALAPFPFAEFDPSFKRFFRVVEGAVYKDAFASDRTHMIREDGSFASPPPEYPCIVAKDLQTMTLPQFWDMSKANNGLGMIMDESSFISRFILHGKSVQQDQPLENESNVL